MQIVRYTDVDLVRLPIVYQKSIKVHNCAYKSKTVFSQSCGKVVNSGLLCYALGVGVCNCKGYQGFSFLKIPTSAYRTGIYKEIVCV